MSTRTPQARFRRPRRRRENPPLGTVAARFLVVIVLFGVFLWVALTSYNGVPLRSYRHISIDVADTGNLIKHDQVRIAGVRVGQVQSETITPNGRAKIELQLEPDVEVPADTKVAIRANGLLGGRYVELVPGRSRATLSEGATIRGADDALTYGVPEALDVLNGQTRDRLGTSVRELGTGMLGNGEAVNSVIHQGATQAQPLQDIIDAVLARQGATERLLPSLDSFLNPLDRAREDYAAMFLPADRTFRPFMTERAAVRAALSEAPAALASARVGLTTGRRLLGATRLLAANAARTLPKAPAGLRATTALLRESPRALRGARPLLADIPATSRAALRLTRALSPVLKPLRAALDDAASVIAPTGAHACDFTNFMATFRSATATGATDDGGSGSGVYGPVGAFRLHALFSTAQENSGAPDDSGLVGHHPYPPPCTYLSKPYPLALTSGK